MRSSLCLHVCLAVYLPVSMYVCVCICVVCVSIYMCVSVSVCISVNPSVSLSVWLSAIMSVGKSCPFAGLILSFGCFSRKILKTTTISQRIIIDGRAPHQPPSPTSVPFPPHQSPFPEQRRRRHRRWSISSGLAWLLQWPYATMTGRRLMSFKRTDPLLPDLFFAMTPICWTYAA